MSKRIAKKLRGNAGETLAETLVALLISALALIMLAGSISTTARIVTESENKMQSYYKANNDLTSHGASATTIGLIDGTTSTSVWLETGSTGVVQTTVSYAVNSVFSQNIVAAYMK